MENKPKVYFDSCCFIDLVAHKIGITIKDSDRAEHVDFCKRLIKACRDGKIEIYTSFLTNLECLFIKEENKKRITNDEVKRLFDSIILSGESGIIPVQPEYFIIESAKDLAWKYNIFLKGAMDSIHIASALEMECDEFITTNRKSIENEKEKIEQKFGLKIIFNAKFTKCLPQEYLQEDIKFDEEEKEENSEESD